MNHFDPRCLLESALGDDEIRADGPWLRVREHRLPTQQRAGWKLHLSATPTQYQAILQRALPILIAAGIPFKVLRNLDDLEQNLDGRHGLTQVGKAITIYPADETAAAVLAHSLAHVLAGRPGVTIPTDYRYAEDAPVFFRFGAFDNRYTIDALGQARRMLLHPTAGEVIDSTAGGETPPPPVAALPQREPADHLAWLRADYLPIKLLQLSARGATFLAIPLIGQPRAVVLLKTARAGAQADRFGRDALWGLDHEHAMLQRLQDLPGFPPAGSFLRDEHRAAALVRPFLEGETFWTHWTQPDARSTTARRALASILAGLAQSVDQAHQRGIVLRDLSTGNIIIHGSRVVVVDLELAYEIGSSDPPYRRGTAGFYNPQRDRFAVPAFADDHYALLALAWLVHTGIHPALLHAPQHAWASDGALSAAFTQAWERAAATWGRPTFKTAYDDLLSVVSTPADAHTLAQQAPRHTHSIFAAAAQPIIDRALADRANPEVYNYYDGIAGLVATAAEMGEALPPGIASLWPGPALEAAEAMRHVSGLYFGASGIALAAMRDGAARQDTGLVARARDLFHRTAAQAGAVPDLCQGLAGLALAAHDAAQAAQCSDMRQLSLDTGRRLVALSQPFQELPSDTPGGVPLLWPWPQGDYGSLSGARLYGYAHGLAGVVSVLLRLWDAHREENFRTAAIAGLDTLHHTALPLEGDACWWPPDAEDTTCWNAWCHGTPGIVKCLALAVAQHDRPQDRALLYRALRGIALANNGGFCLCHGIASRLDAWCDALPLLNGPPREEVHAAAQSDAHTLASLDLRTLQGPSGDSALGLMTGPLGVLRTLHRWQQLSSH